MTRLPNWLQFLSGIALTLSTVLAIVLFVLTADKKLSEWMR